MVDPRVVPGYFEGEVLSRRYEAKRLIIKLLVSKIVNFKGNYNA